jgi:hypothetical protein
MNGTIWKLMPGLALCAALAGPSAPCLAESPVPDWFDRATDGSATRPDAYCSVVARGRRSYSEDRAWSDARKQLEEAVGAWLAPDVPTDWEAPASLVDALIAERHLETVPVDRAELGIDPSLPVPENLYLAAYRASFDPPRRAAFVSAYEREVGHQRLTIAAGAIGFVLACLAILAGYIRADEATKGYYTNRLRLAAGAAAGVAGYAAYRWLA